MKPVFDPSLLVECPDFVVWGENEPMDEFLLKNERRYSDCQARQKSSSQRMKDAMDHLWSRLTRPYKIW